MDSSVIWYAIARRPVRRDRDAAVARKRNITQMSIRVIEGAIFSGDADKARKIGLFTHVVVMSAIVIGGISGLLFLLLDLSRDNAWWVGALFGVVHGLIGGVVVGAAPKMHPRMGGAEVASPLASGSDIDLPSPARSRTTTAARPRRRSWSATSCTAASSA